MYFALFRFFLFFFILNLKIVMASWDVPNTVVRKDLGVSSVKGEIRQYAARCTNRLTHHPVCMLVRYRVRLCHTGAWSRTLPWNLQPVFLATLDRQRLGPTNVGHGPVLSLQRPLPEPQNGCSMSNEGIQKNLNNECLCWIICSFEY